MIGISISNKGVAISAKKERKKEEESSDYKLPPLGYRQLENRNSCNKVNKRMLHNFCIKSKHKTQLSLVILVGNYS